MEELTTCFICKTYLEEENWPTEDLFDKSKTSFALTICDLFQLTYDSENKDLFEDHSITCIACFEDILKINSIINDLRSLKEKLDTITSSVKSKLFDHTHSYDEEPSSMSMSTIARHKILQRLKKAELETEKVVCEPDIDIGGGEVDMQRDCKLFPSENHHLEQVVESQSPPVKVKVKPHSNSRVKRKYVKKIKKPKSKDKSWSPYKKKSKNEDIDDENDISELDEGFTPEGYDEYQPELDPQDNTSGPENVLTPEEQHHDPDPVVDIPARRPRRSIKRRKLQLDNGENEKAKIKKKRTRTFKGTPKVISCTICLQIFSSNTRARELRRHEANVHGILFQCDRCEKQFKEKSVLKRHILETHENVTNFSCSFCGKGFYIKYLLDLHVETIHKKEPKHLCSVCGRSFVNKHYLSRHFKRHSDKILLPPTAERSRDFVCDVCGKALISRESLRTHLRRAHEIGAPLHACSFENCGQKFITAALLENHILVHGLPTTHTGVLLEQPWKCAHCQKSYSREDILLRHIKAYHTPGGEFICKYEACGKQYSNKTTLDIHEKEVHEQVYNFFCEICNKGFYSKQRLNGHLKSHPGEYNYTCTFCQRKFTSELRRKYHESTHTGLNRPHSCSICGFCTPTKSLLRQHEARHDKNRPFVCECGSTFKLAKDLANHKRMKRASCVNPGKRNKKRANSSPTNPIPNDNDNPNPNGNDSEISSNSCNVNVFVQL